MTKISAHCLVKNEARFVWFAVMSIINHIDTVHLWDTGSNDGTDEILKEIKKRYKNKIDLKFVGEVTIDEFKDVRADMLAATKNPWFLVVDADEVWWDRSIKKVVDVIRSDGEKLESIVVPTINLVGDMFHYQEEAAGNYNLAGRSGHLNLRAINRNIPGLSSNKPHGTWGWTDGEDKMIQDRNQNKIKFIDAPYLHATFLQRSGFRKGDLRVPKRAKKLKHEIGIPFPPDFYYPEAFFLPKPDFVQSPWEKMDQYFKMRAFVETPLRKIKRRVFPKKTGY